MNFSGIYVEEMEKVIHYPVMYGEVLNLLDIKNKKIIVDATVGIGSHALKFFEQMEKDARLIGIDKDEESLKIASSRLESFGSRVNLIKDDFSHLYNILKGLKIEKADIFFFDLGISTYQLSHPERGFSFLKDGPLDMRMDRETFVSAYDLVNNLSENELELIFRRFGEERYAKRIAHFIVTARRKEPIFTTNQLISLILKAVPRRGRIHPATRIFQALRIAVNRELETLEMGLKQAVYLLAKGGRIGVISFHSLEDRIVKHSFKNFAFQGILEIITKKPISPEEEEIKENVASRSAKLRVARKIR